MSSFTNTLLRTAYIAAFRKKRSTTLYFSTYKDDYLECRIMDDWPITIPRDSKLLIKMVNDWFEQNFAVTLAEFVVDADQDIHGLIFDICQALGIEKKKSGIVIKWLLRELLKIFPEQRNLPDNGAQLKLFPDCNYCTT